MVDWERYLEEETGCDFLVLSSFHWLHAQGWGLEHSELGSNR